MKGIVDGDARGALYVGGNNFHTDRASEPPLSTAALRALAATAGQEQTFTCVPPGDGPRIGIDRDEDGVLDADELDAGTSPTDATSVPGGPAFTLVQSTRLDLKGRPPTRPEAHVRVEDADTTPAPTGSFRPPRAARAIRRCTAPRSSSTTPRAAAKPSPFRSPPPAGASTAPRDRPRWSYRGTTPADAISHVVVGADLLTVKGGGAGFAYTLDEPRQGRIAVRLVLGTATVLCAEAPARTSGTPPSPARYDRVGRFTGAPRTPPPPACPQLPVAG